MRVRYAVTFEFETRPPLTHRGEVEGGFAHTCVMRATREAQRRLKPINWSSMVCVLLERLDKDPDTVADAQGAAESLAGEEEDESPATSHLPD
jgi:hypothetical protein